VDRLEELFPLALQIVRLKMLALRRKSVRRGEYQQISLDDVQIADGGSDPSVSAERSQRRDRLIRAISQMGDRCRKMFALKLEGKDFGEIKAILGAASINTVYAWDFRCRKQLLELMGGRWEKDG
jgi:RNA polymerase sigma-70 factor (ECF subfamily)